MLVFLFLIILIIKLEVSEKSVYPGESISVKVSCSSFYSDSEFDENSLGIDVA